MFIISMSLRRCLGDAALSGTMQGACAALSVAQSEAIEESNRSAAGVAAGSSAKGARGRPKKAATPSTPNGKKSSGRSYMPDPTDSPKSAKKGRHCVTKSRHGTVLEKTSSNWQAAASTVECATFRTTLSSSMFPVVTCV